MSLLKMNLPRHNPNPAFIEFGVHVVTSAST